MLFSFILLIIIKDVFVYIYVVVYSQEAHRILNGRLSNLIRMMIMVTSFRPSQKVIKCGLCDALTTVDCELWTVNCGLCNAPTMIKLIRELTFC